MLLTFRACRRQSSPSSSHRQFQESPPPLPSPAPLSPLSHSARIASLLLLALLSHRSCIQCFSILLEIYLPLITAVRYSFLSGTNGMTRILSSYMSQTTPLLDEFNASFQVTLKRLLSHSNIFNVVSSQV